MNSVKAKPGWIALLFVLGFVTLNPPIVRIFDMGINTTLFGLPILYTTLFGIWLVLIILMRWLSLHLENTPHTGKKEASTIKEH